MLGLLKFSCWLLACPFHTWTIFIDIKSLIFFGCVGFVCELLAFKILQNSYSLLRLNIPRFTYALKYENHQVNRSEQKASYSYIYNVICVVQLGISYGRSCHTTPLLPMRVIFYIDFGNIAFECIIIVTSFPNAKYFLVPRNSLFLIQTQQQQNYER